MCVLVGFRARPECVSVALVSAGRAPCWPLASPFKRLCDGHLNVLPYKVKARKAGGKGEGQEEPVTVTMLSALLPGNWAGLLLLFSHIFSYTHTSQGLPFLSVLLCCSFLKTGDSSHFCRFSSLSFCCFVCTHHVSIWPLFGSKNHPPPSRTCTLRKL